MKSVITPKYFQLKEKIKNSIRNKELGINEQIETEHELASKCGISRNTVRQALGELVSEGWLYRIQGKGTFVGADKTEIKSDNKVIGVVITHIDNYIFPSIIRGIDEVLSDNGYNMMLAQTSNKQKKEEECLLSLTNSNLDGIIIEPTKSALPNPNLELYRQMQERRVPIVFINGYYRDLEMPFVVEDDIAGGYIAAKHLIDLGHEKISGVFKIDDIQGQNRFCGFVKAFHEAGLEVPEEKVLWFTTEDLERTFEGRERSFVEICINSCTASVCYNDQVSMKLIEILKKEKKSVPDQFSVVSFDNSELAEASDVKLTTVAHPRTQLGKYAAQILLSIIEMQQQLKTIDYKKFQVIMPPQLIIRKSTAKRI